MVYWDSKLIFTSFATTRRITGVLIGKKPTVCWDSKPEKLVNHLRMARDLQDFALLILNIPSGFMTW